LEKHKRLMGFVPQSDIMYRNLTVEENLTYSACFR
jgi:ABC-type multidrug transport system ATPase subunit